MDFIQQIQLISSLIVTIAGAFMAILLVIEKSENIKWKPLSKLFGNKDIEMQVNKIEEKVNDISKVQENLIKSQKELVKIQQDNELGRIRCEILSFVQLMKNDYIPDEVEFQHIHAIYDKYTKNGGNSYIHTKMEYIKKMEELYNNK